jgi:cell division protein FtsB
MTPDYYYQVQGQLFVTAAPFCEFIVYTKLDIAVDKNKKLRLPVYFFSVYSGLDFLAYSATLQQLENENEELKKENEDMKKKLASVIITRCRGNYL